MIQKFSNSWDLIKASARVLQADKELIVFPIVSAIGVVLVTITFVAPMFLADMFDSMLDGGLEPFGYLVVFAYYVVQYFVIIFTNSALVGAAMIRLRGGDPTVGDGFRIAVSRIGTILGYALVAATVGMILRALSRRRGILAGIVVSLVGLAWNLATFLVVPVLVVEGVGPIEAVKRSANLLKRTWGEQIVGNFSIGLIFGLAFFLVILFGIPVFITVASTESLALILLTAAVFVGALLLLGVVSSTLNGIYVAALYRYAEEGDAGQFFSEHMVRGAFRAK